MKHEFGDFKHDEALCQRVHHEWNELVRRWTFPIVHELGIHNVMRFNELRNHLPDISATSLSERLGEMEKGGIVTRKIFPEIPPRVEYALTEKGRELYEILGRLARWALRWNQPTLVEAEIKAK